MAATPKHAARVLGLDDDASLEDVRRARRVLAKKYHPDCSPDVSKSNVHMARVNTAADTLIAHLLGKANQASKARQPSYKDFSNSRAAKPKNHGQSEKAQGPRRTSANAQASTSSCGRGARPMEVRETLAPALVSERSTRDNDLIRLASKSYRTVLRQIAQPDEGPTVDARALRFTTAA